MGTSELNAGDNPATEGVEIILVASCYGNWDKPQSDGATLLVYRLFTLL